MAGVKGNSKAEADQGATGPGPKIDIAYADNVIAIDHQNFYFYDSATPGGTARCSPERLLLIIVNKVLDQADGEPCPLYSLEQNVCQALRDVEKSDGTSFKDFTGTPFREFLEKSSQFDVKREGNEILVTRRKGLTERNTAQDETPGEWRMVTSKKKGRRRLFPPSSAEEREFQEKTFSSCNLVDEVLPRTNLDEDFVKSFLQRKQDSTFILTATDEVYIYNATKFTIDLVSLWNTPRNRQSWIILGVEARAIPPHRLVGLKSTRDQKFYQSLFLENLFPYSPKFTYRESQCSGKRVGIIEISRTASAEHPCIVESNDLAPTLEKDQLWARRGNKNVVVPASDPFSMEIYSGFGRRQKQSVPETHKEAKGSSTKSTVKDGDSPPRMPVTYASAVQGNPKEPCHSSSEDLTTSSADKLFKSCSFFKKGHFILVCGSFGKMCRNIETLSMVPWIAVYDFDFRGRDSGLLSVLEDSIKVRRSLSVSTWCDTPTGITERGTQWWSLRGRRDISDSKTSDNHNDWLKQVRDKVEKLCLELARFSEDYTVLTVVVLLPSSETETRCMHKFLTKVHEHTKAKFILCSEGARSKTVEMMEWELEGRVELFQVSLSDFCSGLDLHMQDHGAPASFEFRLPMADGKCKVITNEDAAWLSQDLEVLYLDNPHTKNLTSEDLSTEADNFFRGGSISWNVWYDMEPGCLDVKRCIAKDTKQHIKKHFIERGKNGRVTIYHAPGAGGSTMAQRLLWDLHEDAPCVQLKPRTGSSMEEVAERLAALHKWTNLSVIALLDGEDEARLKQLTLHLQRSFIVIVHVKRYPYPINASHTQNPSNNTFYLPGVVNKRESRNLNLRFSSRCEGDQSKKSALAKLDADVQEGTGKHQMYEYGMTVYHHAFRGVRSYVQGYLRLEGTDLEPWQKCLGFLALVYYYGQSSFPCHFAAGLLEMQVDENRCVQFEDLPEDIKMFVVPDVNEGRGQYVRICHYVIAKEILEQILSKKSPQDHTRDSSDELSKAAKRNLKDFCIEFITMAASKKTSPSMTSQTVTYVLAKTFIFRDNKEVSDIEEYMYQKRKPQFSQILSDVDSEPPYNGRLEVLQTLCKSFPYDPNIRAHLGRFYTCCRPNEEDEAEKHFKEAIKLCNQRADQMKDCETDERSKLNMMQIYHMYGMFYLVRVAKYLNMPARSQSGGYMEEKKFHNLLNEVVANAERACDKFQLSRQNTPVGHEESYIYINEIHVRLQTCEFVRKFFKGRIQAFLKKGDETSCSYKFIKECVTEIEDLIMECYTFVLLDTNVADLCSKVHWYNSLLGGCADELRSLVKVDDLTSLRLDIAAKKLKFRGNDIVSVESPAFPLDEIESVIRKLERIFQHDHIHQENVKNKLELDFKDWILAIRNPGIKTVYPLERVHERVRQWHGLTHSPQSTFYLFTLLSLLGFGTKTSPGNTECLVQAKAILEEKLQNLSKTVVRPRYPREWLGRDDFQGIKRLVSSSTVGPIEDRRIKVPSARAKLAVCKGTIRPKTKKVAGFIDLDLGENTTPVNVFFVPVLCNLEGLRFEGKRVQFHLAFTLESGYEAYEVALLDRYRCGNCHLKVEMTGEEESVLCACGSIVMKNEHTSVHGALSDDEDDDRL